MRIGRRLAGWCGLVLVAAGMMLVVWQYRRMHACARATGTGGWVENRGDYAGPATRAAGRFDPSKKPSRPWVDSKRAAAPLTTYRRVLASSIGGHEQDFLVLLPPGDGDRATW